MNKNMICISRLLFAALVLVSGCEKSAITDQPKLYSKTGLEFQYPMNWKVTEDAEQADRRYLFVETPGDAILIIMLYSAREAPPVQEFARDFAQSAKQEVPIGKVHPSTFGSVKTAGGHEVLTEKFTITVLGEKVPHSRTYVRKPFGKSVSYLIAQVADEDLPKVTKGFEQIITSFRYSAP